MDWHHFQGYMVMFKQLMKTTTAAQIYEPNLPQIQTTEKSAYSLGSITKHANHFFSTHYFINNKFDPVLGYFGTY